MQDDISINVRIFFGHLKKNKIFYSFFLFYIIASIVSFNYYYSEYSISKTQPLPFSAVQYLLLFYFLFYWITFIIFYSIHRFLFVVFYLFNFYSMVLFILMGILHINSTWYMILLKENWALKNAIIQSSSIFWIGIIISIIITIIIFIAFYKNRSSFYFPKITKYLYTIFIICLFFITYNINLQNLISSKSKEELEKSTEIHSILFPIQVDNGLLRSIRLVKYYQSLSKEKGKENFKNSFLSFKRHK